MRMDCVSSYIINANKSVSSPSSFKIDDWMDPVLAAYVNHFMVAQILLESLELSKWPFSAQNNAES